MKSHWHEQVRIRFIGFQKKLTVSNGVKTIPFITPTYNRKTQTASCKACKATHFLLRPPSLPFCYHKFSVGNMVETNKSSTSSQHLWQSNVYTWVEPTNHLRWPLTWIKLNEYLSNICTKILLLSSNNSHLPQQKNCRKKSPGPQSTIPRPPVFSPSCFHWPPRWMFFPICGRSWVN